MSYPSSASFKAQALPMPLDEPVTRAVLLIFTSDFYAFLRITAEYVPPAPIERASPYS